MAGCFKGRWRQHQSTASRSLTITCPGCFTLLWQWGASYPLLSPPSLYFVGCWQLLLDLTLVMYCTW